MEKVSEMTTEPVIGKFYLVECVNFRGRWIPISGDAHSDPELMFPEPHFHYDIRFVKHLQIRDVGKRLNLTPEEVTLSVVTPSLSTTGEIQLRRIKCHRKVAIFPYLPKGPFMTFHQQYLGRSVKCGKCPHRQIPLESLPQDSEGNVICNGHGLKINMKTNKVVERVTA